MIVYAPGRYDNIETLKIMLLRIAIIGNYIIREFIKKKINVNIHENDDE